MFHYLHVRRCGRLLPPRARRRLPLRVHRQERSRSGPLPGSPTIRRLRPARRGRRGATSGRRHRSAWLCRAVSGGPGGRPNRTWRIVAQVCRPGSSYQTISRRRPASRLNLGGDADGRLGLSTHFLGGVDLEPEQRADEQQRPPSGRTARRSCGSVRRCSRMRWTRRGLPPAPTCSSARPSIPRASARCPGTRRRPPPAGR